MKTASETAYIPGRHGGRLLAGGKKGNRGGGRHPDWLKEFCDAVLASPRTKAAVREILSNDKHPAFAAMFRATADRAHGKAAEQVNVKGDIAIRVIREVRRLNVDD